MTYALTVLGTAENPSNPSFSTDSKVSILVEANNPTDVVLISGAIINMLNEWGFTANVDLKDALTLMPKDQKVTT